MILAAGIGERMRPLTDHTPKPLLPVAGVPLIGHHIDRLARAGFRELVINVSHLAQQIVDYCGDGSRWGLRIQYSPEDAPLETAGVFTAPCRCSARRRSWWSTAISGSTSLSRGCWTTAWRMRSVPTWSWWQTPSPPAGGFPARRRRPPAAAAGAGTGVTYAGVGVYAPGFFAGMRPGKLALRPLLDEAIPAGRVSGEYHSGQWQDVGTPERLAALDAAVREARVP